MESEHWRQIERLYHAALEREGSGRTAFLREACGGDHELRREVESLLASGAAAGTFMEAPAIEVAAKALVRNPSLLAMDRDGVKSGSTVSHYQILEKLGAGGMGEVYRARDTKLGREVALKVLPEALAHDRERMARFQREAKILASLNHPNIATIYGLEESGNVRALVMELVEGPTLAERLVAPASGRQAAGTAALPIDEALGIAKQIAEALEYAHEHGVIHRDLKPANLKIKPDGAVKVLDFGIAKALEEGTASTDISSSPTPETAATRAGMILGTAAYMSPEQARGQAVDRRTDIWAFGCLLYEMLTGKHAFPGDTAGDTLAAVITKDPDWDAMPGTTPAGIQKLVRRCLTKDPKRRLQAIGEARIAIEEVETGFSAASGNTALKGGATTATARRAALQRPLWRRSLSWATALVLAALAAAAMWLLGRRASVRPPPAFHQLTFDQGLIYSARFVPGGRSIYYSAAWNGQPVQLYETRPSSPESRRIGPETSALYTVSPSEMAVSIGCKDLFIGACEGTLAIMPLSGGAPREIARNVVSADWTANDRELAAIREVGGKFQVEFPLGNEIYKTANWLNFVRISPDGAAIAFVEYAVQESDKGQVVILDPGGRQVARSETFVSVEGLAWAPRANEVWFGAALHHQAWADAVHALTRSGKERVILRLPGMLRLHDISRDGRILLSQDVWRSGMRFRAVEDEKERDLSWLDDANVTDLSPDGDKATFFGWGATSASSTVYMRRTDGSPAVKLGEGEEAGFSPDGNWVLTHLSESSQRLALLPVGVGQPRELSPFGIRQFAAPGWMPDGKEIYFAGNDGRGWRMYIQDLTGSAPRTITPLISVNLRGFESHLVSPDGKFVFARDLNGRGWLYPVAGGNPESVPGLAPADIWINWSGDGRSAYVCQNDITHAQVFRIDLLSGKRHFLTELGPSDPAGLAYIVPARITPDGKFIAYSYERALSSLFLVSGVR